MLRKALAYVVPAGLALCGAWVGLVIQLRGDVIGSDGNTDQVSNCATDKEAFLDASDYGDFVQAVDNYTNSSFPGMNPEGFEGWRGQGFFTSLALQSHYMQENAATARSRGYTPPTNRPFLPLSGSIILDSTGLLEVYQTMFSFETDGAAAAWMNIDRSGRPEEILSAEKLPRLPADEVNFREIIPTESQYERYEGVTLRRGAVVMGLSFQGGPGLTAESVVPYVRSAISKLETACGGNTHG